MTSAVQILRRIHSLANGEGVDPVTVAELGALAVEVRELVLQYGAEIDRLELALRMERMKPRLVAAAAPVIDSPQTPRIQT